MSLYGFPKEEHVCGKKDFQLLFKEGDVVFSESVRMIVRSFPAQLFRLQAGMVVPKKIFRHAVDRNRVKRLLREAYRHHKPSFAALIQKGAPKHWQLLFLYTGRELPSFQSVEDGFNTLLNKFKKRLAVESGKKNATDLQNV